MNRVFALILSLQAASVHASAASTKLAEAKRALESAQYQAAARLATGGLQAGDAGADETWALHALLGEVLAATGDKAGSVRAFSVVASVNPSFRPAAGASPRILEPFQRARNQVPTPLRVQFSARREDAKTYRVTVQVENDTLGLVEGVRLLGANGLQLGLQRTTGKPSSYESALTCAAPCDLRASLLDAWGNALMESASAEASAIALPLSLRQAAPSPTRAIYQRPGFYLAVASVLLASGAIYFGARAQNDQHQLVEMNAQRSAYRYPEALALDGARKTDQTYMWLGLGGAALAGAGAVWVW